MTQSTTAFSPLETRAAQMGGANPPDRISVRDHITEVEIGAFQAERDVTQRLKISVVVEVAPSSGAETDDVDDILSYDAVTEAITAELAAERLNLLETLAERIADRILHEPQPLRVFVRIEKLDRGPGNLGVEIVRQRVDNSAAERVSDTPHPRILHLTQAALQAGTLDAIFDAEQASEHPVIVTLSVADGGADLSGAARRIALLDIERAAWALAARLPRCVPVGTRTELDWGMKNGQLSVWTPSKMVLDAVQGPRGAEGLELARWFAGEIGAREMLIVDVSSTDRDALVTRAIAVEDMP